MHWTFILFTVTSTLLLWCRIDSLGVLYMLYRLMVGQLMPSSFGSSTCVIWSYVFHHRHHSMQFEMKCEKNAHAQLHDSFSSLHFI